MKVGDYLICKVNFDIFKKGKSYEIIFLDDVYYNSIIISKNKYKQHSFNINDRNKNTKNIEFDNYVLTKYVFDYFYTDEEIRLKKLELL